MSEYVLTVVCDHTRQPGECDAPARVVSRITYRPKPPNRFGWIVWRELLSDDPGQPPALQTYFGEARRLGRQLMGSEAVPGMGYATRWRFFCPDCEDTLPLRGDRAEERFEELRLAGERFVLLSQIAPFTR